MTADVVGVENDTYSICQLQKEKGLSRTEVTSTIT